MEGTAPKAYKEEAEVPKGHNEGRLLEWGREHPGLIFIVLIFGVLFTLIGVLSVFMAGWEVGAIALVLGAFAGWFCCMNLNATYLVALDRARVLERKKSELEQSLKHGAEEFAKLKAELVSLQGKLIEQERRGPDGPVNEKRPSAPPVKEKPRSVPAKALPEAPAPRPKKVKAKDIARQFREQEEATLNAKDPKV